MYVIIHKGRVTVGPLAWSQKYYTDVLRVRHRVQANIPGIAPEQLPYVIDDNTTIHQVTDTRPDFDPMVQYLYGPLWDTSNDVVVANYEVRELDIESARNNFRAVVAQQRYKKEVAGIKVNIQGTEVSVSTARSERDVLTQSYLLLDDGQTINWKFPEGWFTLTKSELGDAVNALSSHIQSVFNWEKEINDEITQAQTNDELSDVEIEDAQTSLE
jgi:hypothetical protein